MAAEYPLAEQQRVNPEKRKKERMSKIFGPSGKTVIVALDDSSISGPEGILRNMRLAIGTAVTNRANAILGFSGMFDVYHDLLGDNTAGILNITLSTEGDHHLEKRLVGFVEDTERVGVEAVSVHVNTTSPWESDMLENLGKTASACREQGVPLLAHVYPRRIRRTWLLGRSKEDHYQKLKATNPSGYAELVRHGARIAADLGADIIKVPFTGTVETFKTVVESAYGKPVVMAGGPKTNIKTFLENSYAAMQAGASGVAIGRNYFQRSTQEGAELVLLALNQIVHEGKNVSDAMEIAQRELDSRNI